MAVKILSISHSLNITTFIIISALIFFSYRCSNEHIDTTRDTAEQGDSKFGTVPAPTARDSNLIDEILSSLIKHPIAGFDPDAQVSKQDFIPGKEFMLNDSRYYREFHDSVMTNTGYTSLRARLMYDSSKITQQYSSAILIHSNAKLFGPEYPFDAALFFNDHDGILYWSRSDKNSSINVREFSRRIIHYVDTILALKPGSYEQLASEGDLTRLIAFVGPEGHRNLIYGADIGYHNFDYNRDSDMFSYMPKERFTARKYLDSLIGTVAAIGDPVVYGKYWK